jgi:hypothetical protein
MVTTIEHELNSEFQTELNSDDLKQLCKKNFYWDSYIVKVKNFFLLCG